MRAAAMTVLAVSALALSHAPTTGAKLAPAATEALKSPDGRTSVTIQPGSELTFTLNRAGARVLAPSRIGITIEGTESGGNVREVTRSRADRRIEAVFYPRRSVVRDRYEELTLVVGDHVSVVFRAYDDAVAYRFVTSFPGRIRVNAETMALRFEGQPSAYLPYADCDKAAKIGVDCFHTSYEEPYVVGSLASLPRDRQAFLPALVEAGEGRPKVLVTESDLDDYPGLWVRPSREWSNGLDGLWAAYPIEETVAGGEFPQALVVKRAPYLAETDGRRAFPWRILALADHDADLPATDVVYRLGGETGPGDWSWLTPGKSQSEWLWDNVLYDVPFVSGLNTDTYRSYIDFATTFHTGYLFFDAGWSKATDPLSITPGLDVPALVREARAKGLGVVLWHLALAVDRDMDAIMDQLKSWGATGIMVDFMDRDDQRMVQFYRRVVEHAAARHLLVNFHGAFKPTGLERRWPNAVTREAAIAFEYNKWSDVLTPEYEVTVPFIRGVAGPFDYEPGSMRNAQRDAFKPMGALPMSQGTRMHQAAMYLLYESPYAKMGGNVSDYRREPAFTAFLASIPTLWSDTRVLDGRVADYIVMLRCARDGTWWLAAMTDWTPRDLEVPLSFLPAGSFHAELWEDGPNAVRYGADWSHATRTVRSADRLRIRMAPGGGAVFHFSR